MENIFINFKINFEKSQKFLESKFLLYFVIAVFVFKIINIGIELNLPQNIFFADITKITLENLVNQTRGSLGLKDLKDSPKLDEAAQMKAEDMVKNNYFSHTSPTGVTPWYWFLQSGYNYRYAGENLAVGFYESEEVYKAWLNSPSHKANIINSNYTEIGTAILKGFGNSNTIIVVQLFGTSQPVKIIATKNNTKPTVKIENIAKSEISTEKNNGNNFQAQVLSQSTQSQNIIGPADNIVEPNTYSKFLNFAIYSHDALLQDIIFGISLIIIAVLLSLLFFNNSIKVESGLILRSILIFLILGSAFFINKEIMASLIPHQIII
jgi:uncharacterized protein YkwD